MFGAGATIREINTVRKHLSLGRGGYLAAYAYPARVVSLIFSDVPGERPEFVASGPTMRDTTTVDDAKRVFAKYGLETRCGISPDALIETPKEEKYFVNVRNVVIVSNEIALEAMRRVAESFGFRTAVDPVGLNGEVKDRAAGMVATLAAAGPGSAVLWGGEGTVTMQNGGKGGRNLEFALSALQGIRERQIIVSVASDGRDNTEFAGGIADTLTRDHAVQLNVEPAEFLRTHSSFDFFSKTGDYLMTGDTGSNVADLAIALYE
jgi:glycerate-2-kinase